MSASSDEASPSTVTTSFNEGTVAAGAAETALPLGRLCHTTLNSFKEHTRITHLPGGRTLALDGKRGGVAVLGDGGSSTLGCKDNLENAAPALSSELSQPTASPRESSLLLPLVLPISILSASDAAPSRISRKKQTITYSPELWSEKDLPQNTGPLGCVHGPASPSSNRVGELGAEGS